MRRRLRLVVRFSDAELEMVRGRAALAGLATAAWVGQTVVEVANGGSAPLGLVDLLRLHADVLALERVADGRDREVAAMLARLDVAVDAVVADVGRTRR